MANEIRRLYGAFGTVGQVGQQLNWTHARFPEPSIQVSVASRSGRTKVHAQSDYSNLMAFFMPVMFASSAIVAAITIESLGLPTGLVIFSLGLWLTIYWMVVRSILTRQNRKEKRRARKLTDQVEEMLRGGSEIAELTAGAGRVDGILTSEGMDEPAGDDRSARPRRQHTV